MRSLSHLAFASLAASASLYPRQAAEVIVTSVTASGDLCPPGTFDTVVGAIGDAFTVGFDNNVVGTDAAAGGSCTVEATLVYPPGCTTALLTPAVVGFLSGTEGVTATLDVDVRLSTGRSSSSSEEFRVSEPALADQAMTVTTRYPIEGSLAFNVEEETEVTLSIEVGVQVDTGDENGSFQVDTVVLAIANEVHLSDWETCM